jgi:hypothetical protein
MLWYKAWREIEYRLLFSLGMVGFWLIVFFAMRSIAPPPGSKPAAGFAFIATSLVVVIYTWLARESSRNLRSRRPAGGSMVPRSSPSPCL